jgi:ADP-ribose diphosphatase
MDENAGSAQRAYDAASLEFVRASARASVIRLEGLSQVEADAARARAAAADENLVRTRQALNVALGLSTAPRTYTHPDVFSVGVQRGWAEAEADPARIDWPARQAAAAIPFEVIAGRPVNPCEKTSVRYGRNEMGYWGETLMADALVTVTHGGVRHLLMVERGDGYGWAVPGGHVEPGETSVHAAMRELAEETGLLLFGGQTFQALETLRAMPPRYVPDPRASDEAWAVTIPVHISLGTRATLPAVAGGDDARRAEWIPAGAYRCLTDAIEGRYAGTVFAAHVGMLREFLADAVAEEGPR